MAHVVEEVVKPHEWSIMEAFSSGRTAFRIGVERTNNPFKGSLGDKWMDGWNDAAATIPYSLKRENYSEERYDKGSSDRRGKSGGKSFSKSRGGSRDPRSRDR